MLTLTRDLIALRRQHADLHAGSYATLAAPDGVWAWRRGSRFVVVLNLSESDADLDDVTGRISIATDRARDGEALSGALRSSRVGRRGGRALTRGSRGSDEVEDLRPSAVAG